MIVWDLVYSLTEPDFRISFQESYQVSSNLAECRYFTHFTWPYFGTVRGYSHMVGHAGSPTRIVHVDDLDPIQGQGHRASKLPISQNCTFLRLSPPSFWHGAQN